MKGIILTATLLAALPQGVGAQPYYHIPVNNRVVLVRGPEVAPPGTCSWQVLDTLIKRRYGKAPGLPAYRMRIGQPGGRPEHFRNELRSRGIRYDQQPYRTYDRAMLVRHARTGALVSIYIRKDGKRVMNASGLPVGHAVAVVGFKPDGSPVFLDPSNPDALHPTRCLRSMPAARFYGRVPYSGGKNWENNKSPNWLGNSTTILRNR